MTLTLKKHGAAIIWLITGIAIIVSAILLKDTGYENAWFYILAVGIVLASAFEAYSRIKNKNKR